MIPKQGEGNNHTSKICNSKLCMTGGMTAIFTSVIGYRTSQNRLAARDIHTIFRPNILKTRSVVFPPATAGGKILFARFRQRPEIGHFASDIRARQDVFSMYAVKKFFLYHTRFFSTLGSKSVCIFPAGGRGQ